MTTKITRYLIFLTILFLPAYLVKLSVFGIPTNVLEILILLAVAACLAESRHSLPEFYKKHKTVAWAVAVIFAGTVISTLANHNYAAGLGVIKGWLVLPLAFSWVVYKNSKSEKNVEDIYKWLYVSIFWVALASLGFYFTGRLTYDGRLEGFFNSPNYLAMYLAPGVIIALSQARRAIREIKNQAWLYLLAASLAIILGSFYLTYSYAAWAAVAGSLIITEFVKNKWRVSFGKVIIVAGILLLIIFSQWNSQKFTDLRRTSERSSFESRRMVWQSAAKILGDNFVLGIGPGNFQNKYLEYQKYFPAYLEWVVPHPHNLFLAFWLYGGTAGIAGFLVLIIFWLRRTRAKEKNSLWAISFAIMLYFLLHGLVDTTYFKNDLAVIFWINYLVLL